MSTKDIVRDWFGDLLFYLKEDIIFDGIAMNGIQQTEIKCDNKLTENQKQKKICLETHRDNGRAIKY